jgi:hypothetical protein
METISQVMRIEVWGLAIGLATIVFIQMMSGTMITKGLLDDKVGSGSAGFSPARLQLLASTAVVACYYVGLVVTSPTAELPTLPNEMLLILGGSHTFYLGTKTVALILETFGLSRNQKQKP